MNIKYVNMIVFVNWVPLWPVGLRLLICRPQTYVWKQMCITNMRGYLIEGGTNQPIERPGKIGKLIQKSYSHMFCNYVAWFILLGLHNFLKINYKITRIPLKLSTCAPPCRCCDVLSKWQFRNSFGALDALTRRGARTLLLIFVLWSKKVR